MQLRVDNSPGLGSVADIKAALLLKDGSIVSHLDALSPLTFPGLSDGPYYVAVYHRNHLPVMSSALPTFVNGYAGFDFTDGSDFGSNAQQNLGGGFFGLWGGDGDQNGNTSSFDFLNVWLPQNGGSPGYHLGDFNFSGDVTAFDFLSVWLPANGQATQVP